MTRVLLTLGSEPNPRESNYASALERAGASVLRVRPGEQVPDSFDALLLSGGGDVNPARYGAADEGAERIDDDRDALELSLLDRSARERLPILGICRGFQLLNVWRGGRLTQHVEGHRPRGDEVVEHEVVVAPRTLLEAACGRGPFGVNSRHHQVVHPRDLARGTVATVVVDDIVEALELPYLGWVVGVQWHPERTSEVGAPATRVFDAFVRAAGERAR